MKTKKVYMQPEMKTIVLSMPFALLTGSGTDAGLNPGGTAWGDETEDI